MILIENINELLSKSFPRGTVGDWHKVRNDFTRDHRLGYIASSDPLGLSIYGKFTEEDGSALVVGEKYADHAEVYAHLYQQQMRKPVRVEVSDALLYR